MAPWKPFPHAGEYAFSVASVRQRWVRLHAGDAEPLPGNDDVLMAWALFHSGEFQRAFETGLRAGVEGVTVANKAACIYANYLESREKDRLVLFLESAERARELAIQQPANPNAWFWQAYALGRYSQGISVARALAQGLGKRVKEALERTIELQPQHADAHIALGTFHAEVIDKVGSLIGGMTYGARKETGLKMFADALALNPESAMAKLEYARGMVMLEGQPDHPEATRLYQQAAAITPMDAKERLDRDLARAELQD
jgi:tetratricopeptide (TPR) repeat protein